MQQTIHDTSMAYTDTCTIVIDIFNIGRTGVLVDGIHSLEPQQNFQSTFQVGHFGTKW